MKEPKVIEILADNGEHSHWQLIDENCEIIWSEKPTEVKKNAVLQHVSKSLCDYCGSEINLQIDAIVCGTCREKIGF